MHYLYTFFILLINLSLAHSKTSPYLVPNITLDKQLIQQYQDYTINITQELKTKYRYLTIELQTISQAKDVEEPLLDLFFSNDSNKLPTFEDVTENIQSFKNSLQNIQQSDFYFDELAIQFDQHFHFIQVDLETFISSNIGYVRVINLHQSKNISQLFSLTANFKLYYSCPQQCQGNEQICVKTPTNANFISVCQCGPCNYGSYCQLNAQNITENQQYKTSLQGFHTLYYVYKFNDFNVRLTLDVISYPKNMMATIRFFNNTPIQSMNTVGDKKINNSSTLFSGSTFQLASNNKNYQIKINQNYIKEYSKLCQKSGENGYLQVEFLMQEQGTFEVSFQLLSYPANEWFDEQSSVAIIVIVIIVFVCILGALLILFFFKRSNNQHEDQFLIIKKPSSFLTLQQIEIFMQSQNYNTIIIHFPQLSEIKECVICLTAFDNNDSCRRTMCFHIFHVSCIDLWLKNHNLCPFCRQNLDIETLQQEIETKKVQTNNPYVQNILSKSQITSCNCNKDDIQTTEAQQQLIMQDQINVMHQQYLQLSNEFNTNNQNNEFVQQKEQLMKYTINKNDQILENNQNDKIITSEPNIKQDQLNQQLKQNQLIINNFEQNQNENYIISCNDIDRSSNNEKSPLTNQQANIIEQHQLSTKIEKPYKIIILQDVDDPVIENYPSQQQQSPIQLQQPQQFNQMQDDCNISFKQQLDYLTSQNQLMDNSNFLSPFYKPRKISSDIPGDNKNLLDTHDEEGSCSRKATIHLLNQQNYMINDGSNYLSPNYLPRKLSSDTDEDTHAKSNNSGSSSTTLYPNIKKEMQITLDEK